MNQNNDRLTACIKHVLDLASDDGLSADSRLALIKAACRVALPDYVPAGDMKTLIRFAENTL